MELARCGSRREWRPIAKTDHSRESLPLHIEIRAHSPTGFSWGYGGSGPAQLALALLTDALGEPELAERHYQAFKWAYVSRWTEFWTTTAPEIRDFVTTLEMGEQR